MRLNLFRVCLFGGSVLFAQPSPVELPAKPLLVGTEDATPIHVRELRAKHFNVRRPYSMLEPSRSGVGFPVTTYRFAELPELPLREADTIIVGEVSGRQPFLAEDRKGLYTEHTIRIIEVVKATPLAAVSSGSSLTIARAGGAATLPGGREVRHRIANDIVPAPNQRYLLFLEYRQSIEAFDYLKFWLIDGGIVKPLWPDDLGRQSTSRSTFAGKPLPEVVEFLRSQTNR